MTARVAPGRIRETGVFVHVFARLAGRAAGTSPPAVFLTLGRHRRLFWGWLFFAGALMPGGLLPRRETELVILRVATLSGSAYELTQHRRLGRRAGLTADEIDRVSLGPADPSWGPRDRVLLRVADALHARCDVSDRLWTELRAQLDEREAIELVMLVGHYAMLATTLNTCGWSRTGRADSIQSRCFAVPETHSVVPAMTTHLVALVFDANDPVRLARFWAGVLGRELTADPDEPDVIVLQPSDDTGFRIEFSPTQEPKTGPNQMHFDLTSQSPRSSRRRWRRALELGGRHIDIGQGPDAEHVVMADPEGNEFCVIPRGQQLPGRHRSHRRAVVRRHAAGRVLLERGAGLAAGLGPGRGDRDPVAARRLEDLLGRSARGTEAREEPPAPRRRAACRR